MNTKHVYAQARGSAEHITLLCCASAAGIALPPMIIFSQSFPGGAYRFDGQTMLDMGRVYLAGTVSFLVVDEQCSSNTVAMSGL